MQFITGADITGALPTDLNWVALADPQATTVVYMGKRTAAALADRLMAQGLPAQTPVMLASGVSTPDQILTRGTLGDIAALVARQGGDTPALILIGPLADSPA